MRTNYLLPFKSRYFGIALILVHIPIKLYWDAQYPGSDIHRHIDSAVTGSTLFSPPHLFFIGTTLMVLIGLFLIAFSKEKVEDEQIVQIRLDSLRWAIYLNYAILLFSLVFTETNESTHILFLNMWLPLLFFILRFQWMLYRLNRSVRKNDADIHV
jgi:hypothetical protein